MLKFSKKYLDERSPKAQTSYSEGKFQVKVDVKDYNPEEVSIKTEGNKLVILARHETKTEHERNMNNEYNVNKTFASKKFQKRFTLPSGCEADDITSSFSKDGVLTVTVPINSVEQETSLKKLKCKTENGIEAENTASTLSSTVNDWLPRPIVSYDNDKVYITLDCKNYKPEEIDVKVESNRIIIRAKQEINEEGLRANFH